MLDKKPELIFCTAKAPPKKDDGQSPLQVAIKTGHYEIAHWLLDSGADINFMETESVNEWRMPVVHDAITRAVMSSRYTASFDKVNWHLCNTKEQADEAFFLLKRMVEMGADLGSHDSYGNSCLLRAISDARQILPSYNYSQDRLWTTG